MLQNIFKWQMGVKKTDTLSYCGRTSRYTQQCMRKVWHTWRHRCHLGSLHRHIIRLHNKIKSHSSAEEMWGNFGCTVQSYVTMQLWQSAVLFCSSLMWCVLVYRLHLCGPDNAVSLIILCRKTVLIMGHYPQRPLLLLKLSLNISLNLTWGKKKSQMTD